MILAAPTTAFSTEVTVRRLAVDGVTPIQEVTRTYQWMEANLPVYGDGNTYYYFQGPIFEGEWETNYGVSFPEYRTDWNGTPPDWLDSEEIWDRYWNGTGYDQMEETNWQIKNLGKLKGTNIKDLCELVGGLPSGQVVKVIATDNVEQSVPYSVLYTPTDQLGPYVLTWWSVDAGESGSTNGYTGPDYTTGMRATFFSDDSRNQNGEHVTGLGDQAEAIPEDYWYYYGGQYPSIGGWTLKYVDRIHVYTNDPVPLPEADFFANTKTGLIQNGNFETGTTLSPWTASSGATRHTGSTTYRHGNASVKLAAPIGTPASIEQVIDLTSVGSLYFWRYQFGGTGKYFEVLVDDTVIANFTETVGVPNKYETVDISSYNFTGTHTVKFRATHGGASGTFTVYLDDIEDYGPGTSGSAPLSVQFTDLSTKVDDSANCTWTWDFQNDDSTDSTSKNPLFTYPAEGNYTVKLTVSNVAGSDSETKIDYIMVTPPPPVANFSANVTSGTAPLSVQFTDESTNTPTSWTWAYKNATTGWIQFATTQNPVFTFPAGTYDINLTATNAAGSDDEIKPNYLTITNLPYIDISISGSIDQWNFQTGTNEDTESVDLTVDTTMDSWIVSIHDDLDEGKPAGTEGKMAEWTSGTGYVPSGKCLENALQVKSGSGNYVMLSGSAQPLQSGTTQGILPFDITLQQEIAVKDPALENNHQYHIVITFTGAAA